MEVALAFLLDKYIIIYRMIYESIKERAFTGSLGLSTAAGPTMG